MNCSYPKCTKIATHEVLLSDERAGNKQLCETHLNTVTDLCDKNEIEYVVCTLDNNDWKDSIRDFCKQATINFNLEDNTAARDAITQAAFQAVGYTEHRILNEASRRFHELKKAIIA